ncbi:MULTISPECIES: hypothetical protein [Frankia]|uniref:Uncharacterized protein n=1 Tax=Frankia alni (strain DSM 45986 / CECT 9034 / ACN14a) TaxID=326424 RepID=Q0RSE9_FRAAA|nr:MULTISPECIES: hypothetical protein [Frankia]CAJ59514.1 hypothetical protein; putative membrane protein [Frankia alni ACN14a]
MSGGELRRAVDLAAALLHALTAGLAADAARDQYERDAAAARARREQWERQDARRQAGGPAARRRAAGRMVPWALGAFVLLGLHLWAGAARGGGPWSLPWFLLFATVAAGVLAVHVYRELGLAAELAGDYRRPGSGGDAGAARARAQQVRRANASRRLQDMDTGPRVLAGLAMLAALAVVIVLVVAVPPLWQAVELVVATRGVAVRRADWSRDYRERRRNAQGDQPGRMRPRVVRIATGGIPTGGIPTGSVPSGGPRPGGTQSTVRRSTGEGS